MGDLRHLAPHQANGREGEEVQVISRTRTCMIRVLEGVFHEPHGRFLKLLPGHAEGRDDLGQRLVVLVGGDEVVHLLEEGEDRAAAIGGKLAAHKVQRLDAVGALIDHGNARIAHKLFSAPFPGVAGAAIDLLAFHRVGKALVGAIALEDGRHQAHEIIRLLTGFLILCLFGKVAPKRGPHQQRAGAFVEGAHIEQHAAHIRVHDDRVGRAVLVLRPGKRAALDALKREVAGVLVGDFRLGDALQADAEARFVHHGEHGAQALVLLTDEPALGAVIVHHAGGVAVDAHLLFKAAALKRVALAQRAVVIDQELRHDEQRDAADAFRCALDPGEHQVDDVVGHRMLTGGDPDLLAGDRVAAIAIGHGLGAQQAQIGAAMGLGQVHGAGPLAGDELGQIHVLLFVGTVVDQR